MVKNICLLMYYDTLCLVGVAGGVFRFLDSTHMDESYGFKTMGPSHYSPLLLLSLGSMLFFFFIIPCLLLVSCFLFFNCLLIFAEVFTC